MITVLCSLEKRSCFPTADMLIAVFFHFRSGRAISCSVSVLPRTELRRVWFCQSEPVPRYVFILITLLTYRHSNWALSKAVRIKACDCVDNWAEQYVASASGSVP